MSWISDESHVPHYMLIHTDKLSFMLWFQGRSPHPEQNIHCLGWPQGQGQPTSHWSV